MTIIALDLGTHTGWALLDKELSAGTKILASSKEVTAWGKSRLTRRNDPRIQRLFDFLQELVVKYAPSMALFEDVEFSTYTKQTQLWASFRAALWLVCSANNIPVECVPVTTLKKFATGHGGATKEMMMDALFKQYPNLQVDSDGADACWLALWAKEKLCRTKLT